MSRRIPPSTVSVRRIVSDILNMAVESQTESALLPQVQRTVALAGREFQKLAHLFASGQLSTASSCEDGIYNRMAKPVRGRLRSHLRPNEHSNEALYC